ncbi:hypothetical protein YQE_03645, partial [Dendroctonus ponderosae]
MSLLLDPLVKKTYDDCKYTVKVWEHKFTKKHKRIPCKLDIREAPTPVRDAYRRYFKLKSAALEESFMDVEGLEDEDEPNEAPKETSESEPISQLQLSNENFTEVVSEDSKGGHDDIWGSHLNKKKSPLKTQGDAAEKGPSKPVLNISKKLFCGSKFTKTKRNPRKSLSQKKTTESSSEGSSLGTFKSEDAFQSLLREEFPTSSSNFQVAEPVTQIFSQPLPVSIVDSVLEQRERPTLRKVDTGWLQRVTQQAGVSLKNPELPQSFSRLVNSPKPALNTQLDYDSDEIIGESDVEDVESYGRVNHVAKKARLSFYQKFSNSPQNTTKKEIPLQKALAITDLKVHVKENITNNVPSEQTSITKESVSGTDQKEVNLAPIKAARKKVRELSGKKPLKKTVPIRGTPSVRRSARETRVKASFQELSSGEEDPFASDNNSDDPEFVIESDSIKNKFRAITLEDVEQQAEKAKSKIRKTRPVKPKRERKSKDSLPEQSDVEENTQYELEYNVKPRIVASRFGSIKNVLESRLSKETSKRPEQEEKPDKNAAKEKLEKRIAAGSLNENFVRINIQKKVFVRGKKGQNFAKYKKAMWRSKKKALYGPDMDMGGCDGGKLMCFNCGQEGHFAQRCKADKDGGLLPLTGDDEECTIPSLEEASRMAAESNLNIRKSKLQSINENAEKPVASNSDNSSEDEEWLDDGLDQDVLLEEIARLEEHVKKLDVQQYMDNVKVVEPYYTLQEDGRVIASPPEVFRALEMFGHTSFRAGQETAIMRILSGKSTLVTLSTGSGKSLCYQLPAYLYSQREPCISLVISPLVSLMEDQVTGIPKFLKAACLHTNQTKTQRQKIMEAICAGDLNVLLISPEAIVAGEKRTGFGSLFRKLPPIAFACIDEAHCVSQWSHNFRPSYLMICHVLKESLGVRTILGLTATATRATCESIVKSLEIPDGLQGIISDVPLPDNLHLTVSKDPGRERALLSLLLSERFKKCQSIIVYCTRREECERIAGFLRTSLKGETVVESSKKRKRLNLQAEPYHAGLSASRRRTVQNAFMSGELKVVVATVAFGMGINKADIRAVVHFNMPHSFENYVQEVGRAGRDGLPAHCHVFLDSLGRDECELRRHIHANSIDRHVIRKLLQRIFLPCACKGTCPKHEVAFSVEATVRALDIPEENISTLLCYLELHENKYIELLNPAYTTCKVISYGGPLQIRKAAKDCPPLAMALALHPPKELEDHIVEFPVVDVASAMGWESGICKHQLKNLEWTSVNNQPKRSSLTVQFGNLGFRMLAPGNLSDEQLDEALDNLHGLVLRQESKALRQLHAVHKLLAEVAERSYKTCITVSEEKSPLKEKIREYFNSADPLEHIEIKPLETNEEQLVNDVRTMINMYRDNQFTGRALARIFHGIQSPNYPAVVWGRCKFWRSHINEDFHEICRIATREIIRCR